ncbi:iron-containing alcohol dehydrogenase [Pseudomonas sp. NY15364]|uniref:iron-containing alcohol dehydrogenase n=1 Tax=Pseudomonas sp. NY15364 TaxID=3400353 RepID=UPI003A85B29D
MLDFSYYNPTRIHFGKSRLAKLNQEIPADARVLLLYGGGSVVRNGTLADVRQALGERQLIEFAGIEPNPSYERLSEAVAKVKAEGISYILAVGGGSVIDGAKYIAAAACMDADGWAILESGGRCINRSLPVGVVLTLAATGSEMNNSAVVTRVATQDKMPFASRHCFPVFAILDPTRTLSVPAKQVSNGVVDAFTHVIEQYLTHPVNGKVQDRFAEGLLLTLIEEGPKALQDPQNYDVRANLMWAASLALNGLIGAGVPQDWSTHMIGHELTAVHGLDHAQTLAVILPAMLAVRRTEKAQKLLQYAERVWGIEEGSDEQRISAAIARTREFFEQMGVATRLSDYGIQADQVPRLIAQLERHGMTALGERRDVTLAISTQVLQQCL